MSVRIYAAEELPQGSPEWHAARAGKVTASEFSTVMAKGRDGGASKTRRTYMLKLAGEIITGLPAESYSNAHMERGHEWEPEARRDYSILKDVDPQLVGFICDDIKGCSPDSLVGDDGGLEIKSAAPHIQIERLLANDLPPEHKAQVQGCMWVTGRSFWDFVSYSRGLPLLVVRVTRDDDYINTLAFAVDRFNEELMGVVDTIRRYGEPTSQAAE